MSELDWTNAPALLTLIAVLITRAWKSRELSSLRSRIEEKDDELFEARRAHKTTKRLLREARGVIDELESEPIDLESEED